MGLPFSFESEDEGVPDFDFKFEFVLPAVLVRLFGVDFGIISFSLLYFLSSSMIYFRPVLWYPPCLVVLTMPFLAVLLALAFAPSVAGL